MTVRVSTLSEMSPFPGAIRSSPASTHSVHLHITPLEQTAAKAQNWNGY